MASTFGDPAWSTRYITVADLNGDNANEAFVRESSSFCYGATAEAFVLLAKNAKGEWTVLLDEVGSPRVVELVAKKIMQAMEAPFVVGSHAIPVGATIGVGLADAPGVTAQAISELADGALYEAKGMGRNRLQLA